ncbi:MAG: hypothetical protein OXP70_02275 [Acidobacteriota bacterium]|nr:hypothetical protein [Acidobacteriota bacterium]
MHPWKISLGVGIAVTAALVFFGASRLDYLSPYRRLIVSDYWWPITAYAGSAFLTVVIAAAGVLRSLGLYDIGRKVDLAERSVRRGDGDPELSRRLTEQDQGDFND